MICFPRAVIMIIDANWDLFNYLFGNPLHFMLITHCLDSGD